ncbi:MFS DHA1 transporter [Crepidotus variabilis]|uniref:MFS DHA1 transporter n=1 Tax=Crepidotus variabilis TaxID=179855 RepID=A0A9P6JKS2_9AGAR|nr:MFS DHA1 transporter [Crepidotus variabilis]
MSGSHPSSLVVSLPSSKVATTTVEVYVSQQPGNYPTKEFFLPIPKHLRYHPDRPFTFSYAITVLYSLSAMVVVMNVYYCQPLLIQMAESFHVSYGNISRVPTFTQAGYACGLFVLLPFADIIRRRQFTLVLVLITILITIGQAFTKDIRIFEVLSCIGGFTNITAQIIIPMVAESAPAKQRAFAFSIVLTGIMFGILAARVVAGVIAEYVDWRVVYYASFTLQSLAFICLYFIIPDYPAKNLNVPPWYIHWSTAKLAVTEPLALQVILINLGASSCFAYFWVTMTFLLGGPPYQYSTLDIGLFGLIGLAGVAASPICGRICDRLHPWHGLLIACFILLLFQAIQTAAGGTHLAALIVAAIGLDIFQQVQNVGLVVLILSVSPLAMARLNALYIISYYSGMMIGTAAGTEIFVRYGWRAAGGFGMGFYVFQICVLLVRGPHCSQGTWFGYEGGLSYRTTAVDVSVSSDQSVNEEKVESVN